MNRPVKTKHTAALPNIRLIFVLVTLAEIIGTLLLSSLLVWIISEILDRSIVLHPLLWLLIFSISIVLVAAVVVNIILLQPIVRLSRAMKQVASGDFNIQLTTANRIREIRETYDSFNLMTRELKATETLQTDFVSNVSHEFKTPITAIEGYATLLQSSSSDPQHHEYVERILLNTRRISTLVGNILLLSKVSNHAIPLTCTTYRLDEQIRQALVLLEPMWSQRNTDFDVDLEELAWSGPESLMHHVWSNLIANAIKFGPTGGMIRIQLARSADGHYIFAIEDQGPGIPEEEQIRVFNKFYQLDSSHMQEGNGLGLALVRQILTICQGDISVVNLPEGGCRFTVLLPCTEPTAASSSTQPNHVPEGK